MGKTPKWYRIDVENKKVFVSRPGEEYGKEAGWIYFHNYKDYARQIQRWAQEGPTKERWQVYLIARDELIERGLIDDEGG